MRHLPLPLPRFGSALDRFFDDVFHAVPTAEPVASPRLDIWEDADAYGFEVELPGFHFDDIEVTVHNGELRLHARRPSAASVASGSDEAETSSEAPSSEASSARSEPARTWLRRERLLRDYARTVELPTDVDASRAEARFEAGVLQLRLPKSEAAKPHRIDVRG